MKLEKKEGIDIPLMMTIQNMDGGDALEVKFKEIRKSKKPGSSPLPFKHKQI